MAEQEPGRELTVRGGRGGTAARLDDLEAAGGVLVRAAAQLAAVTARLAAVLAELVLLGITPRAPLDRARVQLHLVAVLAGPTGLGPLATRLHVLGLGLQGSARSYRMADAGAREVMHQLDLAAGRVTGGLVMLTAASGLLTVAALPPLAVVSGPLLPLAPGLPLPATRVADLVAGARGGSVLTGAASAGHQLLALLGSGTGLVEHVVDALPGLVTALPPPGTGPLWAVAAGTAWPPRSVASGAALIGALGAVLPGLREPARVLVTAGPPHPVAAPRGVADLIAGIGSCYPAGQVSPGAGGRPGTVRVLRMVGSGGSVAWVAEVPGTQRWTPTPGDTPFDLAGNVHGLAGEQTAAQRTVVAALRAAGVRPGEPLLLAGHSQGGMVVAGLAADPAFRAEFAVTHLVTAGAPIAGYRIPDSVHVLSLEHTDDLVPSLDGAPNPDRPGWVTIRCRNTPAGSPADPLAAHDTESYRRTAALVDASRDPSVAAWRAELRPFLAGPGVSTSAVEAVGVRDRS